MASAKETRKLEESEGRNPLQKPRQESILKRRKLLIPAYYGSVD